MKISPAARKHAAAIAARKGRKGAVRVKRKDEELGDVFSDLLGGIPIIGPLISGLTGGGGGDKSATPSQPQPGAAAGGAFGPAPGMMGLPMPGGATLDQIRAVVQDALAGNRDIVERMQLTAAGGDQRLARAADAITGALVPKLSQARGGVQVQRLQTQATSEHRGMQAQADRDRAAAARHAELLQRLDGIARTATTLQSQLGGGSVVTDPRARAILNLR